MCKVKFYQFLLWKLWTSRFRSASKMRPQIWQTNSVSLGYDHHLSCGHDRVSGPCVDEILPKVKLPAPVLQVLPGYKLSCLATGTPPIYKALLRNSTVLVNTTYSASTILNEEGNYTCVATSRHGTDVGEVSVIFTDCDLECLYEPFRHRSLGWSYLENTLSCQNVTSAGDIDNCASKNTEYL
ncbi:hypothetical protein ACROYT_G003461 [Oculina patagonica]